MEKQRWEESERRKSEKKEDAGARKGRKAVLPYVFPMICGSGGSKKWLAKATGAEPSGQMRKLKLHAVVALSTFGSNSEKATSRTFRKSARRCGAKHVSKPKVLKTDRVGALLEVDMSKKCTPVWCEAHVQVKRVKKN